MITKDSAKILLLCSLEGGERIHFRKGKHWQGNSFPFSIPKESFQEAFIYLKSWDLTNLRCFYGRSTYSSNF